MLTQLGCIPSIVANLVLVFLSSIHQTSNHFALNVIEELLTENSKTVVALLSEYETQRQLLIRQIKKPNIAQAVDCWLGDKMTRSMKQSNVRTGHHIRPVDAHVTLNNVNLQWLMDFKRLADIKQHCRIDVCMHVKCIQLMFTVAILTSCLRVCCNNFN